MSWDEARIQSKMDRVDALGKPDPLPGWLTWDDILDATDDEDTHSLDD